MLYFGIQEPTKVGDSSIHSGLACDEAQVVHCIRTTTLSELIGAFHTYVTLDLDIRVLAQGSSHFKLVNGYCRFSDFFKQECHFKLVGVQQRGV